VLNARRHRDGDRFDFQFQCTLFSECSTPGGIETVIGRSCASTAAASLVCSTPGGIETVIGGAATRSARLHRVLNARRHRDGDRSPTDSANALVARCSTPGGIETVIGVLEAKSRS